MGVGVCVGVCVWLCKRVRVRACVCRGVWTFSTFVHVMTYKTISFSCFKDCRMTGDSNCCNK